MASRRCRSAWWLAAASLGIFLSQSTGWAQPAPGSPSAQQGVYVGGNVPGGGMGQPGVYQGGYLSNPLRGYDGIYEGGYPALYFGQYAIGPTYPYRYPVHVDNTLGNAAAIDVRVPAGARLWIEGGPTEQSGKFREFVSPQLKPGKQYVYELKAAWRENGHPVEKTRNATVRAGGHVFVDFLSPPAPPERMEQVR